MIKPFVLSFAFAVSALAATAQQMPLPAFAAGKYGATIRAGQPSEAAGTSTGVTGHFSPTGTILRNMQDVTGYARFVLSAERAELIATLQATGPYTIFAPHDGAFGLLPASQIARLWEPRHRPQLRTMLQSLMVAGALHEADLTPGRVLTTLAGTPLTVRRVGGRLALEDAQGKQAFITLTNQQSSNGTVHALDAVLALP